MRIVKGNYLEYIYRAIWYYPVPSNITYLWNFGFLAGMVLVVQLISGLFLAMHYIPHMDLAFASVEHIMRDVNGGWALRYIHANGASFFFIVVYLHILRGIYFQSYRMPRQYLWFSGVLIFFLLMGTAFLGYLLPWGQMSFWGATVILSLVTVVPFAGGDLVEWVWGGFSVDGPTLTRLYVLHFTLPWILTAVSLCHIILLHEYGSNNPLGSATDDTVPFSPYSTMKDLFSVVSLGIIFTIVVSFAPNLMGHPDNYIMANAMMTPEHIVPEWYFLPYYAILRSVPNKRLGFVLMICSILIVAFLPYISKLSTRNPGFNVFYKVGFWLFAMVSLILGWIGGLPIVYPLYEIGQVATCLYFMYFIFYIPFSGYMDTLFFKILSEQRKSYKVISYFYKRNLNI